MRKTKIICTLGPSTDDEKVLRELMLSGMNVARLNFSHQTHESHKQRYDEVVRMRKELGLPVATLLDTKGPEVRVGLFKDNKKIELKTDDTFILTTRDILGTEKEVSLTYKGLVNDVNVGTTILIDDGLIKLNVISIEKGTDIVCRVLNGGIVSNNKGVNIPDVKLSLPYISEKDKSDIIFGAKTGFDFIAASFTTCAADILQIRNILHECDNHTIKIIAKIENMEGVLNIDEILNVSDGIMVARGDMGVEIPFDKIPMLQKMLIKKASAAGKTVITATQMLDSMMKNPRPTRAEATDVANAIYDGTSAIMLSGETAAGLYPIESVQTMASIAETTEADIDFIKRFRSREVETCPNVTNAISHATVTSSIDLAATAIVTVTKSGSTARMISKYRPLCPIISGTSDESVCRQLNLSWGVIPFLISESKNADDLFENAVNTAIKSNLLSNGDLVVITAGVPIGVSGTTNMLKVHIVGDVLVSGKGITSKSACGNVCVCANEEELETKFNDGDIIVIGQTSNAILPYMKRASGIITELEGQNSHAAIVGLTLDIPVIVGAQNATKLLRCGTTIKVDAQRGIVCTAKVAK